MRWPRGKYNGRRITGFEVKVKFDVLPRWWTWRLPDRYGTCYGLARIQWEGPWTKAGVPARAAYRHTHWVGCECALNSIGIFDINAMGNGTGWCSLDDWAEHIVPWILEHCVPRASGRWHITHAAEVERPAIISQIEAAE